MRAARGGVGLIALLPALLAPSAPATAVERRCGWLENPTPGNFSLRDRRGEWLLGVQGGQQARGIDGMPDMATAGWVETSGHYGYGCACLLVDTDRGGRRIVRLHEARPIPLGQCRADRALP